MKYLKYFENKEIDWKFDEEESPPTQIQSQGLIDNEDIEEEGNIRCNDCYWVGIEEDLKLVDLQGTTVELCPECKSQNLMDIENGYW